MKHEEALAEEQASRVVSASTSQVAQPHPTLSPAPQTSTLPSGSARRVAAKTSDRAAHQVCTRRTRSQLEREAEELERLLAAKRRAIAKLGGTVPNALAKSQSAT